MATPLNSLVQLSYASLGLLRDQSFSKQILCWLSLEERERYRCFVDQYQAKQYLLARALLRSQLSERVPSILPSEWVFSVNEYGKPRLADRFSYLNLSFNLSHSEDLVVLALSEGGNLGVDVESIHRPVFSQALAKRYFSKTELAELMMLTAQQQTQRIAQLWTLKESYLKANGLGIRVPLAHVEFSFEGRGGLDVSVSSSWVQSLPVAECSFIHLFGLGFDYSLALTVEVNKAVKAPTVVVNEWNGLNGQLSDLPCVLLRKTAPENFVDIL